MKMAGKGKIMIRAREHPNYTSDQACAHPGVPRTGHVTFGPYRDVL